MKEEGQERRGNSDTNVRRKQPFFPFAEWNEAEEDLAEAERWEDDWDDDDVSDDFAKQLVRLLPRSSDLARDDLARAFFSLSLTRTFSLSLSLSLTYIHIYIYIYARTES